MEWLLGWGMKEREGFMSSSLVCSPGLRLDPRRLLLPHSIAPTDSTRPSAPVPQACSRPSSSPAKSRG